MSIQAVSDMKSVLTKTLPFWHIILDFHNDEKEIPVYKQTSPRYFVIAALTG